MRACEGHDADVGDNVEEVIGELALGFHALPGEEALKSAFLVAICDLLGDVLGQPRRSGEHG